MIPMLDSVRLVLRGWRNGWSLCKGFEGKGYAIEAARRVQLWAHEKGLQALMSFVHPENLPSQSSVAKRLGATLLSPTILRGEPRLRFRHILPS